MYLMLKDKNIDTRGPWRKDMFKEMELGSYNNNIGSAIQYFRETYHIPQRKLCKGLCSVSTLSRIEAGERDADGLILETLLERLGRTPHQFELILTGFDYEAYTYRKDINKLIEENDVDLAYKLINRYDNFASDKGSPHKQFVIVSKARLNELEGGKPERTIDMLKEAISCTVPDFSTNEITDYLLSISEFNIILDILQKMISLKMAKPAKRIIDQIINYLYWNSQIERKSSLYPKVAAIAGSFFIEEKELDMALKVVNKGLEMNKGSRSMSYLAELNLIKAEVTERKLKSAGLWARCNKDECISLYLKAYHIFSFFRDSAQANDIKKHLEEVYQWVDID